MNLKEAYGYSERYFKLNNVDESDFKALCIVCCLAGIKNSEFSLHLNDDIKTTELTDLLERVKSGEPLQYVLGKWDFYESEFYVGKGVLIPRPETEELVDRALFFLNSIDKPVVIDLCSGSGCIGISIAKKIKSSKVYCIEKSKEAFCYLKKNSREITNVQTLNEDIFEFFDVPDADLIISNPPYIKTEELNGLQMEVLFEPIMALDGGSDGLDFYRAINEKWFDKLKNGGHLLLEIGNEQGTDVKRILTNYSNVNVYKDIYGNDRIVIADKR